MMPSSMPACTAVDCAAASWSSSCHCNQRWKSTASACLAANSATAGRAGCRSSSGQSMPIAAVPLRQRTPDGEVVEAAALALAVGLVGQLAARGSLAPGRRFQRLALDRPRRIPVDQLGCVANPPAAQAAPCGYGRAGATSANSGIASTRRYSGLTKRRDVGRYGDGSIGATGAAACSGLTRMYPAPCTRPTTPRDQSDRSNHRCPRIFRTARCRAGWPAPTSAWHRAGGGIRARPGRRSARCSIRSNPA